MDNQCVTKKVLEKLKSESTHCLKINAKPHVTMKGIQVLKAYSMVTNHKLHVMNSVLVHIKQTLGASKFR